ncbi:ribonuclease P protein subunit p30 [Salmo salar]|uniref:Ribonuclease P protein subunit p30 n=1 Tax=Salmo salar TaxID=8030 RepID=B5XGI2_SALSA|nr:ribonuclease P protein subunit p30 [Salmo salar]ACI69952.1 Ribonuclease P protein subunit p30 [Salmo salar]|eukprot:NP_001135032.1 ribonuclease P protein subunit p30 [Salmo salar]
MAVFMDLNITYTTDKKRLRSVIETAAHLGYSTVAINYVVDLQQKKQEIGKPKCVLELFDTFPIVQGKSRPIKVLNRLTVVASDPSHFRPNAEYKAYDLVAVYPKTEKLFHAACMTFDVDIICVAVTEKQPSTMRRYTIANAISLTETCKGKNLIVTSGAERPLELRGPYDIANLGLLFGLSEEDGKAAISTNCRAVHLHGETRKTALGIVHTMKKDQPLTERQEEEHVPASKRAKLETVDS